MLRVISNDYRLDSLKGIYSLPLASLGDLNIEISNQLEKAVNAKEILKNHQKLNQFLLKSPITTDLNKLFNPYGVAVASYSIEHLSRPSSSMIYQYSKIETSMQAIPMRLLYGGMWIGFKKITKPNGLYIQNPSNAVGFAYTSR